MSYRIEREHYTIPKKLKRNTKLQEEEREDIKKLYASGEYSLRTLAQMYEVTHKTIYYIVNPQKYAEALKKNSLEKHSKKYYDKDKHREYMRRTREYRKTLNEMNLLEKEN